MTPTPKEFLKIKGYVDVKEGYLCTMDGLVDINEPILHELMEEYAQQVKPDTIKTVNPHGYLMNGRYVSFDFMQGVTVSETDDIIPLYSKQLIEVKTSEWQKELVGLTAGGSEFVNDPKYCAQFVRDRQEGQHKQIIKLTKPLKK